MEKSSTTNSSSTSSSTILDDSIKKQSTDDYDDNIDRSKIIHHSTNDDNNHRRLLMNPLNPTTNWNPSFLQPTKQSKISIDRSIDYTNIVIKHSIREKKLTFIIKLLLKKAHIIFIICEHLQILEEEKNVPDKKRRRRSENTLQSNCLVVVAVENDFLFLYFGWNAMSQR
ncbi:hypothetical protein DERP_013966, partial [Dermatophagoides pteronyssinus]